MFGFRYALLDTDVKWKPEDFTAIAVYSDLERTGYFTSSHALLNQFVENTVWSCKSNHMDIPTDCPTRERHGWTGDIQVFQKTAQFLFNYAAFARKYLRDLYDLQKPGGRLPQIAPYGGVDFFMAPMIEAIAAANPSTAVVLCCGSAVECPWADKVGAILYMGLGGQAMGEAAANLLYGRVNPSGRLTESWPYQYEDCVCASYFGAKDAQYREGVYVGYRYYDAAGVPVRWPFGHGLCYTAFAYSDLSIDRMCRAHSHSGILSIGSGSAIHLSSKSVRAMVFFP